MTEKEQKAIELLKEEISRPVEVPEDKFNTFILYNIENTKIILNLISKQQSDIEIKDKVINYIAKHTYIRTGENGVLGTITEEVIEHLYKKVEEENVKD